MLAAALALGISLQPAAAETWSDPAGDVTLANADLVCGGAFVFGETVHMILRFRAPAFGGSAHQVLWCMNLDADSSTGNRCNTSGGDVVLDAERTNTGSLRVVIYGDVPEVYLDQDQNTNWDGTDELLHVWFPLRILQDDGAFDYVVTAAFGGSFGDNEKAPDTWDFDTAGGFFSSQFGPPSGCGLGESPVVLIQILIDEVNRLADEGLLAPAAATSLLAKLEASLKHLEEGHPRPAGNLLVAFINEVEALVRSGRLPADEGASLIEKAMQAARALGASFRPEGGRLRPAPDQARRLHMQPSRR